MEIELSSPVKSIKLSADYTFKRISRPYHSGKFVAVRPVKDNPEDKTFFGIMLGDMNVGVRHRMEGDSVVISSYLGMPGIFIPSMSQIIYGPECFWKFIGSHDQLAAITDLDLQHWGKLLDAQIAEHEALVAQYAAER